MAFISNAEEEAKLQSERFQNTIVDAITRAVQRYKHDYEVRIGVVERPAPAAPPSTAPAPAAPKTPASPVAEPAQTRTE